MNRFSLHGVLMVLSGMTVAYAAARGDTWAVAVNGAAFGLNLAFLMDAARDRIKAAKAPEWTVA